MRAILTAAILTLLPTFAQAYDYCSEYLRFLNNAVYAMRIDAHISPATFKDQGHQWVQDLNFINAQRRGFDFREWLNAKGLGCWENHPYGHEFDADGYSLDRR